MNNIVIIEGDELIALLAALARHNLSGRSYRLRVCIDSGGAKFKSNESTWSPPYGRIEQRD